MGWLCAHETLQKQAMACIWPWAIVCQPLVKNLGVGITQNPAQLPALLLHCDPDECVIFVPCL